MNRQFKEFLLTAAALASYGIFFLCVIGVFFFLVFGVLAVWNYFFDLL